MQTAREEERQRNTRQREQPGLSAGPHRRQDRWTRTCRPAPTHAPGRGWAGASHLLDGAQRVRVLLLRLLDLSQAAAPLVILCHLGLRPGRTGWCWGARGCPPPAHAPTQAQAFVPTHRHGHGLRAHEVLVDLVALRLLVLHTVIQVLILLHCVTAGCGVRQGHRSPQARDPSEPSQTKVVSPQIPSAGSCPLRPPGHSLVPLRPPGQGYVPKHSLNLVGQATVDIFIPHTLLLSGEGPRGARMV